MNKQELNIYRFKVSLHEIDPEIWRIFEVPQTYTFWDLHVAIQDAMGWLDYHLHSFKPKNSNSSNSIEIGIPEGPKDDSFIASWTVPISNWITKLGDKVDYEYDFGDKWLHQLELLDIKKNDNRVNTPRCLGGERACPPEDCGGVPGYYQLLDVLSDPDHQEYQTIVEWLKGHAKNYMPYKPDNFDPKTINFRDPKKSLKTKIGLET